MHTTDLIYYYFLIIAERLHLFDMSLLLFLTLLGSSGCHDEQITQQQHSWLKGPSSISLFLF